MQRIANQECRPLNEINLDECQELGVRIHVLNMNYRLR